MSKDLKKQKQKQFSSPHLSCVFLPSCVVPESIYGHLRVLIELRTNQREQTSSIKTHITVKSFHIRRL